jgi:hypothetical protein
MKCSIGLLMAALVAGPMLAEQLTPTPNGVPAASVDPNYTPTPTPTPSLVENIIKLWKANLSEDFLKKYISGSDLAKDLSAEDIVKLRNAGLPENLISAVSERKAVVAGGGMAAAAPGGYTGAPAVAPAPTPTPALASLTSARWEGLAKRNTGVVILKSRWDPGVLEFKEDTLRWTDGRDAKKNVLLTAKQITEQQLTCLKKPGGNECFEWVVKSKGQEYRFRDISWEQGEDAKPQEVFRFMKALFPNLVSSQVPVDEK